VYHLSTFCLRDTVECADRLCALGVDSWGLAQEELAVPYGIRSVIGFGGALPSGEVLAVLLFAKVPVSAGVAAMFRLLSLSLRKVAAPYADQTLFASPSPLQPREEVAA
jgi:hypothetical protein